MYIPMIYGFVKIILDFLHENIILKENVIFFILIREKTNENDLIFFRKIIDSSERGELGANKV